MAKKKKSKKKSSSQFTVKRPVARPASAVVDLHNPTQFEQQVLDSDKPSIIDFWAEWCGPCKATAPAFAAAAERWGGQVNFCKVNTEKNQSVARQFNIRSIPTMILMHQGEVVDVHIGAASQAAIERMAQKLIKRAAKDAPSGPDADVADASSPGLVGKIKGWFSRDQSAAA